jgi:hypothetical protein
MRVLSSSELLGVWECERGAGQIERALSLLEAASPDLARDALAELPVGRRDARLLRLRELTFGPQLVCHAACPACSESLELNFSVDDIKAMTEAEMLETFTSRLRDYDVHFRLPNSLDLLAVAHCAELDAAHQLLFERCITFAQHGDAEIGPDNLPPEVSEQVVKQMSQADPQANVELALRCPACQHEWQALFDIVSFFWSEIDAWARRLLQEVHIIAMAYGWREADTLALSPQRRRLYLEMILG